MDEHVSPPAGTTAARPAEARALAAAHQLPGERILCTTLGRAQAARELAAARPSASVACWFLDEYPLLLAAADIEQVGVPPPNLSLFVAANPPPEPCDLTVIPVSRRGQAELTRDVLQSAWQRLEIGGALVAAVDNPHDHWLGEQLAAWFDKISVARHEDATVYTARKDAAPRKLKDFRCEFAFRDRGRLVRVLSRPGVFSHRRIDPGARQLLNAVEAPAGARILDIGCGAGVVGLALAARDLTASIHAVDSHARAVECTRAGAALNALMNLTAELNSTGNYGQPEAFDVAVANPPYYGDFTIARRMLDAARISLRSGGRVWIVTKSPQWYEQMLSAAWTSIELRPSKRYWIATATKP